MNKELQAFLEADAERTQGEWKPEPCITLQGHTALGTQEWGELAQIVTTVDGEASKEGLSNLAFVIAASTLAPIIRELLADMEKVGEAGVKLLREQKFLEAAMRQGEILEDDIRAINIARGDFNQTLALASKWRR